MPEPIRSKPTKAVPLANWPPADRERWAHINNDDLFSAINPARDYSRNTVKLLRHAYGQYLTFLTATGRLDEAAPISERVTPSLVAEFLAWAKERMAPSSVDTLFKCLRLMVGLLAPDSDWRWMRKHAAVPSTREVHAARKALPPLNPIEILNEIEPEMDLLEKRRATKLHAVFYRNCLLILFLVYSPLRITNLRHLRLGDTLLVTPNAIMVSIPAETCKTRVPIDAVMYDKLDRRIRVWLEKFRPTLETTHSSNWLWINHQGIPVGSGTLSLCVRRTTKELLGHQITPHRFRNIDTTWLSSLGPDGIKIAQALLVHRSSYITKNNYDRSGDTLAMRLYADVLKKQRA